MNRWNPLMLLILLLGLTVACASQSSQPASAYKPIGNDGLSVGDRAAADNRGTRPETPTASSSPIYNAYNIWFEKPDHLYSTGYHVGQMIPAGTQVHAEILNSRTPMIIFTTRSGGKKFQMEFVGRHHPGMTVEQYCSRMFTTKSFGELTEGFSDREIQAIKEGVLRTGMSKKAVIVSWGYPPEILTPTLQGNTWTFQEKRFLKKEINFDENGYTALGPTPVTDTL
jgi:hypothetical protein